MTTTRLNPMNHPIETITVWLCLFLAFTGAIAPPGNTGQDTRSAVAGLYVKKSTWPETMIASRAGFTVYLAKRQAELAAVKLSPWHVSTAQKAEEFSDKFFPEDGINLQARDAKGEALWQENPEYRDGRINPLPRLRPPSTAYVFRTITTGRPISLTSSFGSNDGLEVWLNDKKILSRNVGRRAAPNQDLATLDLAAGENKLLLKIFNRAGGTSFYFSLNTDSVMLLWRHFIRDFPHQAGWMRTDLQYDVCLDWFRGDNTVEMEEKMIRLALERAEPDTGNLRRQFEQIPRTASSADSKRRLELYANALQAGRKIDIDLLDAPLLFVKRQPYMAPHIYDDYLTYHPGGGIYIIENPAKTSEKRRIRPVIDPHTPETLGEGIYRDPDISWNGKRIVFAFKGDENGDTSIYEIGIDGKGLRRLTNPGLSTCTHLACTSSAQPGSKDPDKKAETDKCVHHSCPKNFPPRAMGTGRHDITPAYLPDGRIVFTSTRPAGRVPCFNSLVDVLHIMDPDGNNIRCISVNNVNEFDPAVLPDGRIMFGRWEYIDKTALYMQSLWAMFPDGTNETALFANNLARPTALLDARPIPGTHLIVTALTPHNGQAVGAISVINPHLGKNNLGAITNFTPKYPTEMDQGLKRGPSDPWPLSKGIILIANNAEERGPHGILEMIDRAGHHQLVHAEPDISCYSPMLVKPRRRPKVVAASTQDSAEPGMFFVQDVYQGLEGVARGQAKWLRIIEETARVSGIPGGGRWWNQAFLVSWQGAYVVKNILGVVPVHKDGSIYFQAPPGRALYFELLDDQGREIRRMRTFVKAAPGVTRSCVGCHENKMTTPHNATRPIARLYPPAKPRPESWGSGFIDYPTMIQPILDKHCIACHGGEKGIAGGIDLSGGWTWAFNISYETLIKNTLVGFLNCHNSSVDTSRILPPRTHGSGAAPLTKLLISGHKERIPELTRAERDLILAWMDTNCNYYGTWNWTEHAVCKPILSLRESLAHVMKQANCTSCHSERIGNDWVNLQDPQRSRILRGPLAKGSEGLPLTWCRDRKAREPLRLVDQAVQPPDVFQPRQTPAPDLSGEEVASFASTTDENYRQMLTIIRQARIEALAQARVDMPGAEIIPGVCRQLVPMPLPDKMPPLQAELTGSGIVTLSWKRSAETIGLLFELHRSNQPDFSPNKDTLAGTTTMFTFEDKTKTTGKLYYALVAVSNQKRSRPVYTTVSPSSKRLTAAIGL